jgi:hypothetical protein
VRCFIFASCITNTSQKEAALSFGAAHAAFRYNYVALFSQASNRYSGPADKSVILNLFVKSIFPFDVKYARYHPFNIVGQAGQNVCVMSGGRDPANLGEVNDNSRCFQFPLAADSRAFWA